MRTVVEAEKTLYQTILGVLVDAIPTNPFAALANGEILQVIVFSILLGMTALYIPEKAKPFINFVSDLRNFL